MATRRRGISVRARLALSYAGFLMVTGALLLAVVWAFLLRYVPREATVTEEGFFPGQYDLVRAFVPAVSWAMLALLVFGLLGGWILAGRMLAPLTRITQATRSTAAGSLSHRISLEGRGDEFRELADSFDSMLARLEAQVIEQQRFAANASHELRTPLAITQTLIDVARSDPDYDERELLERLRFVNTRAIQLTEAMLVLSRADQRSFAREPVDLSLIVEEAAEELLPLAEKNGIELDVVAEPAEVSGSRALLLQLTMNLLHNAIVHNLPEGGIVRIVSSSDPGSAGGARLLLENTGELHTGRSVAQLTEPFRRGTDRVRNDQAGYGLGLAIAASIVRAHDGVIELAPREGGGLIVTARFPA